MGIFASQDKKTLPLPFDPPHTVTIRRLTGREFDQAQEATMLAIHRGVRVRGFSDHLRRVIVGAGSDADARKVVADPLLGFDRLVVATAGITGWSYRDDDGQNAKPKKVTNASVADLDDDALEFIATEILRMTKPALFETVEEAEAARKND
jgi:hypothetical protein